MPAFRLLPLLLLLLLPTNLSASATVSADSLIGIWEVEEKDGHIEIYRCKENFCGRIHWLKEPNFPVDDRQGMAGRPLTDRENPKAELRSRPLVGLQIMDGYSYKGDGFWDSGRIYNSENGKTYNSRIKMKSPQSLELRGFIGVPLLGGSTVWKRVR